MSYAQIVFSQPQQLAVLGHALQDYRFLKSAQRLAIDPLYFTEAPMAGKIWASLLEFADSKKRVPNLIEVEGLPMFVKEEDAAIASAKNWLKQATEAAKNIGKDVLQPMLAEWSVAWVMRKGGEDAIRLFNNGDIGATKVRFLDLANEIRRVDVDAETKSSSEWYQTSKSRQAEMPSRLLKTGLTWIDEPTYGLRPDDLLVITSPTGFGKTQLMTMIALNLARDGKNVKFFALEAGEAEIETRIRFAEMMAIRAKLSGDHSAVDYVEWSRGLRKDLEKYEQDESVITKMLDRVNITYKKTSKYGIEQLERDIVAVQDETDAILIDHLHYIDKGSKKNETEALSDIVHRIRDVNLNMDKTVIMAAHVKKNQEARRFHTLLPGIDDVYGSGDVSKTSTWVLALAQPANVEDDKFPVEKLRKQMNGFAPTLARFLKSRDGGGSRTSYTLVPFFRWGSYDDKYTIGRTKKADTEWEALHPKTLPPWAKSAFAMPVEAPPDNNSAKREEISTKAKAGATAGSKVFGQPNLNK